MVALGGCHVNSLTDTAKDKIRRFKPSIIKFLNTAYSPDFVKECQSWGALIVLRQVYGGEVVTDLPTRVSSALSNFKPSANSGVVLEIPLNESAQSGDALSQYVSISQDLIEKIAQAGFRPAWGNFSTGNPPDIQDAANRIKPIIPVLFKTNGFLSLHEYWRPNAQLDGWNPLRYRKLVSSLGQDVPILITESGIDKVDGIQDHRGYKTYGQSSDWYANQLSAYLQEIGRNNYVFGVTFFCSGQFGDWEDFDYVDDDTIWNAITRDYGSQPRVYPKAKSGGKGIDTNIKVYLDPLFSYVEKFTPQFDPDRPKTVGIIIHSTRGGNVSLDLETEATNTVDYFQTAQASSHLVVSPTTIYRLVHDKDEAWHATYLNQTHLGVEVAQTVITTGYTNTQYELTAISCALWCKQYNIPAMHVSDETIPGIIGHEETAQGKSFGKSDPGPKWNWTYFITRVRYWLDKLNGKTNVDTTDYKNLGPGFITLAKQLSAYPISQEIDFVTPEQGKVGRQVLLQSGSKIYLGVWRAFTNNTSYVELK